MLRPSSIFIIVSLSLIFSLTGCSSGVKISPEFTQHPPTMYAFLPIVPPPAIAKDRAAEIWETVDSVLRSKSTPLVDRLLVEKICGPSDCPSKNELTTRFGVQGFITLSLTTAQKTNFIAGYYNKVGGTLILKDISDKELLSVEYSESEKGGLIFNSGQILEGLSSSVKTTEAERFSSLIEKFASNLVDKLPTLQKSDATPTSVPLELSGAHLDIDRLDRATVCADGTPHLNAYLLIDTRPTSLREAAPGRYCGEYLLSALVSRKTPLSVELRTPFGSVKRMALSSPEFTVCNPSGIVHLSSTSNPISFFCTENSLSAEECEKRVAACKGSRFHLYRDEDNGSRYVKVGTYSSSSNSSTASTLGSLYLVAENPQGIQSLPLSLMSEGAK